MLRVKKIGKYLKLSYELLRPCFESVDFVAVIKENGILGLYFLPVLLYYIHGRLFILKLETNRCILCVSCE